MMLFVTFSGITLLHHVWPLMKCLRSCSLWQRVPYAVVACRLRMQIMLASVWGSNLALLRAPVIRLSHVEGVLLHGR